MAKRLVIATLVVGCSSGPTHSLTPRAPSPITQPCNVTGVVLEMRTSDPLPGATLFFRDAGPAVITDETGKFAIERNPNDVTLTIYASSRRIQYAAADLACTQPLTIRIDIEIDDNGDPVPRGEV